MKGSVIYLLSVVLVACAILTYTPRTTENINVKKIKNTHQPIVWIYVPHEYNSRVWTSWGSRSSYNVNQPYINLTIQSIIKKCDTCTICLVDETTIYDYISFPYTISHLVGPTKKTAEQLAMLCILREYGGVICPFSFLCMQNLQGIIDMAQGKMFVCEMQNTSLTSQNVFTSPSICFCGATKQNPHVEHLISLMESILKNDYTQDTPLNNTVAGWCEERIRSGDVTLINAQYIGVTTPTNKLIKIEDLLSSYYLDLSPNTYGIYIPHDQILGRMTYDWFASLTYDEIIKSNTILGNYFLLSLANDTTTILTPQKTTLFNNAIINKLTGFWQTPDDNPMWSMKPAMSGTYVKKLEFPQGRHDNVSMLPRVAR